MHKKISLKIGIVMDPILSINIKKDSSFAILLEAQNRGHIIYYMELNDLYLNNGKSYAIMRLIKIKKNKNKWFEFINEQDIPLNTLDAILMRKDPPFNTEFIYSTYILENAEKNGVLVLNKPQSLRNYNEKIFISDFPRFTPDTLVTRNIIKIKNFWKKHRDIILKPLHSMGGNNIFRITENDTNFSVIAENMTHCEKKFCMVQKYLKDIKYGDKRILIVNGNPIPWCLNRIPKSGETRANLAVGGIPKIQKLNETDFKIANFLSPILKKNGLIFVGLDIIGSKLTEINITSPTGICEIESEQNISITGMLIDYIEKNLRKKYYDSIRI
ncbi:glutathione synthase [Buchnera aphidicola]|uniref:glutathione synthase n=1 Tax=Buchnera aphidicola TaxID=9 RepID=UPI003BEF26E5